MRLALVLVLTPTAAAANGFSSPKPRVPYVLGTHGAIGAILFGSPLNAPSAKTKNSKILWVSRSPWTAGCWRLTLSWAGRQDTLDLRYVAPTD